MTTRILFLALASFGMTSGSYGQTTFYVDAQALPGGDGLSWGTAMESLQDAIDIASASDRVWVAAGTHYPTEMATPPNARSVRFRINKPLRIFGGFNGTETTLMERDPLLFEETILSGDIGVPEDASDNAYRVVELTTFSSSGFAKLDGFRITGGNAIGKGGGLLCHYNGGMGYNPRVELFHCTLNENAANHGGAVSSEDFGVVRMFDCLVQGNDAAQNGAGVYCRTGALIAYNTEFIGNKAQNKGGAFFADSTIVDQILNVNCVFRNNRARLGGALFLAGADATPAAGRWFNCTFIDNLAVEAGGGLYAVTSAAIPALALIYNSILWNNFAPLDPQISGVGQDVRYTDVEGGYSGIGNIDVDPLVTFRGRLRVGSPANDAGSNALLASDDLDLDGDGNKSEDVPYDITENRRRRNDPVAPDSGEGLNPIVDMGAYELNFRRKKNL